MNRMFMFGLRHRLLLLLMLIALTVLAALGMQRLQIDTGTESMVAKGSPKQVIYEAVVEEFGSDNKILIFARDQKLWTTDKLNKLKALHMRLTALESVQSVEDIFTLRSLHGEEGRISSKILMDHVPENQKDVDQLKENALYNPLVKGNLVSSEGDALALMVTIQPDAMKQLGHARI